MTCDSCGHDSSEYQRTRWGYVCPDCVQAEIVRRQMKTGQPMRGRPVVFPEPLTKESGYASYST